MQGVFLPELWSEVVVGLRAALLIRPLVLGLLTRPLSAGDLVFVDERCNG